MVRLSVPVQRWKSRSIRRISERVLPRIIRRKNWSGWLWLPGWTVMGEMYGREVLEAVPADGSSVAVLVPANEDNMNPSYVYSGISSAIAEASKNIDVFAVRTGEDRDFVSEETVRNLLLDEEKRPDVLVCLSAVDTISAYQCVRDYNLVGQVKIIGTYVSTEILEGIGNGVIQSTIVVDAREAGQRCMQAMSEYMAQRYTNEYFPRFCNRFRDRNLYSL